MNPRYILIGAALAATTASPALAAPAEIRLTPPPSTAVVVPLAPPPAVVYGALTRSPDRPREMTPSYHSVRVVTMPSNMRATALSLSPAASPSAAGPAAPAAGLEPPPDRTVTPEARETKKMPFQVAAQIALGKDYLRQGLHEAAVRAFNVALSLDPANIEAQMQLGVALMGMGRIADAVAALEQAQDLDPSNREVRAMLDRALGIRQ